MEYSDRMRTCSDRSAKTQLIEFLQLLLMLAVIGGMVWAAIDVQHYDGYYTDGTL